MKKVKTLLTKLKCVLFYNAFKPKKRKKPPRYIQKELLECARLKRAKRALKKAQKGIYNVAFNGKNATLIKKGFK